MVGLAEASRSLINNENIGMVGKICYIEVVIIKAS
jgi:hypothetical protein